MTEPGGDQHAQAPRLRRQAQAGEEVSDLGLEAALQESELKYQGLGWRSKERRMEMERDIEVLRQDAWRLTHPGPWSWWMMG